MRTPATPKTGSAPGTFVLSTGRSGSTMLSGLLARHPDVLSLSEFLTYLGTRALLPGRVSGAQYWRRLSVQTRLYRRLFTPGTAPREFLYSSENGRYPPGHVPPILATTLPHLTDRPDALFDEIAGWAAAQPSRSMAEHHRALFDHLAHRHDARTWVERSGLSMMHARVLQAGFPDARVVFLHRDGRDVALSLQNFIPARLIVWSWHLFRHVGSNAISIDAPTGASWKLRALEALCTPVFPLRRALANPPPLTACAGFWSEMMLAGLAEYDRLPPDRRMLLGYDTLCKKPTDTLTRLAAFIGVDAPRAWLEGAANVPERRPPRWTALSDGDRRILCERTEAARAAIAART